eukprot:s572_g30.t1
MASVEEWCAAQGIEPAGDLAYFFSSYDEARAEAGEAVAQAWLSAQTEASGSCKSLLLDLYARQSPKAMPHALRLGQPSPRSSCAPLPAVPPVLPGVREAAMPRKRVHPTAALAQVNEEHCRPLEEALRVASRYSTERNSPGAALMVPQLVALVLQRHDHETLKKDSRAPSRVIPSLQFLTSGWVFLATGPVFAASAAPLPALVGGGLQVLFVAQHLTRLGQTGVGGPAMDSTAPAGAAGPGLEAPYAPLIEGPGGRVLAHQQVTFRSVQPVQHTVGFCFLFHFCTPRCSVFFPNVRVIIFYSLLPTEDITVVFEQIFITKVVVEQVVRLRRQARCSSWIGHFNLRRGGAPAASPELPV